MAFALHLGQGTLYINLPSAGASAPVQDPRPQLYLGGGGYVGLSANPKQHVRKYLKKFPANKKKRAELEAELRRADQEADDEDLLIMMYFLDDDFF